MRILFAGTPEIAVPSLKRIAEQYEICGVLTNPDRVRARGKKVLPSPVKKAALELGLPVLQPERLRKEGRELVASYKPDLLVTFAYGRIFGPKFLSIFPLGGVNIHPSLLPEFRGSSPLQSAILAGFEKTGVTVQKIALGIDSGNILCQRTVELSGRETTESLTLDMAGYGAELLLNALSMYQDDKAPEGTEQDHEKATYSCKIEKKQRFIDWAKPARQLSCEVRAFYPWPKAMTAFAEKGLMITFAVASTDEEYLVEKGKRPNPGTVVSHPGKKGIGIVCGEGVLTAERLQLEAKKELDWKSFLNGNPEIIGSVLVSDCLH